ncbi:amidohydrolase family protein [Clostridium sp. AM58-1XD]|uniref:amidohydrolase family protein n=1 Tax=Clostridium sp. AM58-1XD TaxID=2292307 RepID=UPI000E466AD7|nr:amidohydrolase family protein [Clostridium sp. AM58-1XD]RGY97261.1 amidohydrolase family protein [Clostridium sp. AM58-1XD]
MERIILNADTVLCGDSLEVNEKASVIVENGKISEIIPQKVKDEKHFEDTKEYDFGSRTLMPGMIECHNHCTIDARLPEHLEILGDSSECRLTVIAMKAMEDNLMAGITTARSLADKHYIDVELKKLIAAGEVKGPDLLVAGIGMKGAHGHGYIGSSFCGTEEVRRTARENMRRGADLLKIFVTPGNLSLTDSFIPSYLSPEEIRTAVEEGARQNIPTAAHCIGGQGLKDCIDGGVKVIEHMYGATDEDVELLAKSDCWVDLTSGIFLDPSREAFLSEQNAYKIRMNREKVRNNLKKVVQAKIPFVLGTDAYHTYLYREVEYAVELGAGVRYALQGITSNAAKVCGIGEVKGSLKEGYAADVIAVDGNPLNDLSSLARVSMVMKGGKIYRNE